MAAAVATGLGTLGWVTFIGGAILWISFSRTHLPEAEVLAKIPTPVLIATGAEFLVAALAAAFATIVLLFFFDNGAKRELLRGRLREQDRLAEDLETRRRREAEIAVELERREQWLQTVGRDLAETKAALQEREPANPDDHGQANGLESARDRVADLEKAQEEATGAKAQTAAELDRARQDVHQAMDALDSSSRPRWRESILRGLLPGTLLAGTSLVAAWRVHLGYGGLPDEGLLAVIVSAVIVGAVGGSLYNHTASFPIIGLVALLGVPLVMGVATYFRADASPRVEPVALLRSDGSPFVGFFIAETSDRVFVGTFEERVPDPCELLIRRRCPPEEERIKVPARMLSLPATEVQHLTVGPRIPLNADDALDERGRPRTAREWAAGAALRLCEQARASRQEAKLTRELPQVGADTGANETTQSALPAACSGKEVRDLREFDREERRIINDRI